MKKFIIAIIGAFSLFAIQLASAQCHPNTWYNGQIVTYCEGNNGYDAYYYHNSSPTVNYPLQYNNGYYNNGYYYNYTSNYNNGYYNNYNNGYNNSFYNDSEYCDYNYCDLGDRTNEENYYNLLEMNNISIPGSSVKNDDYFKTNIIGKDKEINMINNIKIDSFSFRYASNTTKYNDTKNYIEALKGQIKSYYMQNKISYNKMYTVINDLEHLVYNINKQFENTKIYDSTGNKAFKAISDEYTDTIRTSYERLKFSLQTYK